MLEKIKLKELASNRLTGYQWNIVNGIFLKAEGFFALPLDQIRGRRKDAHIVRARFMLIHAIMYNTQLRLSQTQIAYLFKKHHASISHAKYKVNDYMDTEPSFRDELMSLHYCLYGHMRYFCWMDKK
jgi:chromosomal replication initiation ATPase DnaA